MVLVAKIRWNYGVDGVLNTDSVEIRVFALEMVYAPAGTYKLGSGGTETNAFFEGSKTTPFNVLSESSITVSNTANTKRWVAILKYSSVLQQSNKNSSMLSERSNLFRKIIPCCYAFICVMINAGYEMILTDYLQPKENKFFLNQPYRVWFWLQKYAGTMA